MKDTKPCPGCKEFIFKINGCSQMWCVQCHTTWNWDTGEILENQKIHNPHYIEYKAKEGILIERDIRDIPSGDEIDQPFIDIAASALPKEYIEGLRYIVEISSEEDGLIKTIQEKLIGFVHDTSAHESFIKNECTEQVFYQRHNQREFMKELLDILVALRNTASFIYRDGVIEPRQLEQLSGLFLQAQRELLLLSRVYGYKQSIFILFTSQ
jgi:hypothetical protein